MMWSRSRLMRGIIGGLFFVLWSLLVPMSASARYPSVSSPPNLEKSGQDDAVVIVGIENYAFLPDVEGVQQTVNDWERFFTEGLGVPSERLFTAIDTEATRQGMLRYARRARDSVPEGGRVWFVYMGHGAPSPDGQHGLMVGVDAQSNPANMVDRGLKRSALLETLRQGPQSHTVVLLDACFSGKDKQGRALAEGMQPTVPTDLADDTSQNDSTTVLTAARADQFAGALPGAKRPAFSYLMLGALRGWADDGDGSVTASEAVRYATRHLRHLDHAQTPDLIGASDHILVRGIEDPSSPDLASLMRGDDPGGEETEGDRDCPEGMVMQEGTCRDEDGFDRPGYVKLTSEPSPLAIQVDGESTDRKTPALLELSPGRHIIEVSNATRSKRDTVRVRAGERQKLTLELPAGSGRTGSGALKITTRPKGATILVDGEQVGRSPLVTAQLPAGRRTVTAQMSEMVTVEDVQVQPGETREIDMTLRYQSNVEFSLGVGSGGDISFGGSGGKVFEQTHTLYPLGMGLKFREAGAFWLEGRGGIYLGGRGTQNVSISEQQIQRQPNNILGDDYKYKFRFRPGRSYHAALIQWYRWNLSALTDTGPEPRRSIIPGPRRSMGLGLGVTFSSLDRTFPDDPCGSSIGDNEGCQELRPDSLSRQTEISIDLYFELINVGVATLEARLGGTIQGQVRGLLGTRFRFDPF